jgi:hypothetical protein
MTDRGERDPVTEELRRAFMASRSEGGTACHDAEALAALVLGELPESGRSAIADHAVACARCGSDLRDLMDLHDAAAAHAPPQRRPAAVRWRLAAAAALLLAGAALTITTWRDSLPWSRTPAVERGPHAVEPGVAPPDEAVIPAPPASLSCPSRPDAERYWVLLFDAESTLIWESPRASDSSISIPPQVQAQLGEGRYLWRCLWLHGVETDESPLHRFTITRSTR